MGQTIYLTATGQAATVLPSDPRRVLADQVLVQLKDGRSLAVKEGQLTVREPAASSERPREGGEAAKVLAGLEALALGRSRSGKSNAGQPHPWSAWRDPLQALQKLLETSGGAPAPNAHRVRNVLEQAYIYIYIYIHIYLSLYLSLSLYIYI